MKELTSMNTMQMVKYSILPPFSFKLAYKAEIVRVKWLEKRSVSLHNGLEKTSVSLCNGLRKRQSFSVMA